MTGIGAGIGIGIGIVALHMSSSQTLPPHLWGRGTAFLIFPCLPLLAVARELDS